MEEIARVYARSLFEVASDQDKLDDIREQLGELADALDENRDLATFLFSPYFSSAEKKEGLDRAVQGADEILDNFLRVLIDNHRMPLIFRVRRDYDAMWEEENRLLPVQVTSAIELDEGLVSDIGDRIAEATGREVSLAAHVEPDILGGLVLRVGNSILDASVRNRLEGLRREVARH